MDLSQIKRTWILKFWSKEAIIKCTLIITLPILYLIFRRTSLGNLLCCMDNLIINMGLSCTNFVSPNSCVKAKSPVSLYLEIMPLRPSVRLNTFVWSYPSTDVSMRRGKGSREASTQRKGHVKMQWEKADVCKPRRKASRETKPTNTLILEFQPPELWENTCLLLKPPSLW